MTASKQLSGWPDPWSPIDKATAAALIGVSRDTIERVVRRIAAGEAPPKVRNPLAMTVGKLFAEEEPGSPLLAARIYEALKIDPALLAGPFNPPPAARAARSAPPKKPGAVPSQSELAAMADHELATILSETFNRARGMDGGRVPWGRIKALADELSQRGRPPSGAIHGQILARIDLNKVETWGFVGNFAAQAEPGDLWPFVLPLKGGRPVDLLSASSDDIRYGTIVALTLEEWMSLLAEAIAEMRRIEAAEKLEREIFDSLPSGKPSRKLID